MVLLQKAYLVFAAISAFGASEELSTTISSMVLLCFSLFFYVFLMSYSCFSMFSLCFRLLLPDLDGLPLQNPVADWPMGRQRVRGLHDGGLRRGVLSHLEGLRRLKTYAWSMISS